MEYKEFILSCGGKTPKGQNQRYAGRLTTEDQVRYVPTVREPLVYSLVHDWRGVTRRKGKLSESRVRELYPLATKVTYIVKSTGKVYQTIKIK